jgi:HEAT repeat protein
MRRFVLTFLIVCGGSFVGAARGGEAEDVLARGRKAQLGGDDLRSADVRLKFKGTFFHSGDSRPAFQGDFLSRPDDHDRLSLQVDFGGPKLGFTVLGTAGATKRHPEGDIGEITPNDYIRTARALEPLRMALLAASLRWLPEDRGVLLKDREVGDRIARVVRTADITRSEMSLYFDRETAALLKVTVAVETGTGVLTAVEVVFSGHSDKAIGAGDEAVLKAAGLSADAAGAVELLQKQRPKPGTEDAVKALIAKLGDDDFAVREKATKELAALGTPALPLLEKAAKSADVEVARRAEYAVETIHARNRNAAVIAAVRVLARQKPADASAVLLDSLAWAGEEVTSEITAALAGLATGDGKADPALEKALGDKDEKRRRAAEAALGKDGGAYLNKATRRLYPDGGKFPAKAGIFVDRKQIAEVEFLDVQFVNRPRDRAPDKP